MTSDLRLVVSDIDGTLVRGDKTLSPVVVAAVQRLVAAGVPFSLISARPPSGMLWIARELDLHVPLGAFNGGTVVNPDGTVISTAHVPAAVRRVVRPGFGPRSGRWVSCTAHEGDARRAARGGGAGADLAGGGGVN